MTYNLYDVLRKVRPLKLLVDPAGSISFEDAALADRFIGCPVSFSAAGNPVLDLPQYKRGTDLPNVHLELQPEWTYTVAGYQDDLYVQCGPHCVVFLEDSDGLRVYQDLDVGLNPHKETGLVDGDASTSLDRFLGMLSPYKETGIVRAAKQATWSFNSDSCTLELTFSRSGEAKAAWVLRAKTDYGLSSSGIAFFDVTSDALMDALVAFTKPLHDAIAQERAHDTLRRLFEK